MADPIMWFDFRSADLRGSFYEELLGWRSPRRPVTDRAILMSKVPRPEHRSFLTSSTTPPGSLHSGTDLAATTQRASSRQDRLIRGGPSRETLMFQRTKD